MSFYRRDFRRLAIRALACNLFFFAQGLAADADPSQTNVMQQAIVIQVDEGIVGVSTLGTDQRPRKDVPGVIVWEDDGGSERWSPLSKLVDWPPSSEPLAAPPGDPITGIRGMARRDTMGSDSSAFSEIVQLEQLSTDTLTRAAVLISPRHNAEILQPEVVFRRLPEGEGDKAFPPRVATVHRATGNLEVLKVTFAKGNAEVRWAAISGLSPDLARGLPPGRYIVRLEDAAELTEFTVVDAVQRESILRPIDEFTSLAGGIEQPLSLQFAAAWLLKDKDQDGVPLYLTDAWVMLACAPESSLTAYLKEYRDQLLGWMVRLARDPGAECGKLSVESADRATGIPEIDEIRALLATGRWDDASVRLERVRNSITNAESIPRDAALADLYGAVILAEAGLGRETEAAAAFERALDHLSESSPADRYRGLVNYGNFLMHQAQDRLDNLSFQMAAGVRQPLLSTLSYWMVADQRYQEALALAQTMGDLGEVAAMRVNLARLHALLADVIRTLDSSEPESRELTEVEAAAARTADRFASDVTDAVGESVAASATRAVAHEIRAHLAFRADDTEKCRHHAARALELYIDNGRLAGIESVARLVGLIELSAGNNELALRQFLLSQSLVELLRDQFPPDQMGLSRAGFFARRSYVYERIVELLIASGKPADALHYAELAKARAAQDFLAAGGLPSRSGGASDRLSNLLNRWPRDTAAVEYFLGSRHGWVFLVNTSGQVQSFALTDRSGKEVASRDLIGGVRTFLAGMEHQAERMSGAILSGRGFDHTWQNDLHELSGALVPEAILTELRGAKTVVLVPHHILHYFPFAALVTERDPLPRANMEMVKPRFLLDEPFQLIHAPSLVTWDLLNRQPRTAIQQVTAVGIAEVPGAPPLPGVTKDIENLRAVFGNRVRRVYEAAEARESGAKQAVRQRGLLLLATHGFNDPDQPLNSHLLFLPEESDEALSVTRSAPEPVDINDGRLTAREIFATRVRAEIVVMNACYSGLGDRSPLPGDDLFGLQRAFLQSGSRTVVSGLWDVYDGTAPQLMEGFFRGVAAGAKPSAALAQSQREFLRELRASSRAELWLHPYFWAVFTVAGADGSDPL